MPQSEPAGIRNKNYLNIKNGTSPWLDADGKVSQTDSRGHAIFADPAYGVRAGILLLRKYFFAHNLRTIAEILARWAPATDTVGSLPGAPRNSPVEYSNFVAARMGVSYSKGLEIFNENRTVGNIAQLRSLFYAMTEFEIGNGFRVPDDDFNRGLELVQPGILSDGAGVMSNVTPDTITDTGELIPDAEKWAITASVGRWDKGAQNAEEDVRNVQEMLRNARLILEDGRIDPGIIDGKIGQDPLESRTIQAIEAFQSRFLTSPDGIIDVGGRTWRELVNVIEGRTITAPATRNASSFFFPLDHIPDLSWETGMGSFGSRRGGGRRAHAACDLYAPSGTIIYAITDGSVIRGPYSFYAGTYALEIDHGSFIARYGEIQSATFVRQGDRVRAGQRIARVGHLIGITVPEDMLHLELYGKTASGPLTVPASESKRTSGGIPFLRRRDLIDPTPKLNVWKRHLPGARVSAQERMTLLGGVPSVGFCIHIKRIRQEQRATENHARTIGDYQCYWNGSALEDLKGQIVERGGPGDNTTEIGDNRDLRIRAGAYRLAVHDGVRYKTHSYNQNSTSYNANPKPGLLLLDTDERSAILIHPGIDYVRSIGCLNPASGLINAESAIDYADSRQRTIAIINALKSKIGSSFPRSGTIRNAVIIIEGEP